MHVSLEKHKKPIKVWQQYKYVHLRIRNKSFRIHNTSIGKKGKLDLDLDPA
jgi:hypothetical protein